MTIRVFRLLGEFHWPPNEDSNPKNCKRGALEIGYTKRDDKWHAVLRWSPANQNPADWNSNPQDCGDGKKPIVLKPDVAYRFRGAVLLEQSKDEALVARWPLVAESTFDNKQIYSQLEVELKKQKNFQLRLDLLLPSLIPQVADSENAPHILGFSAWFSTEVIDESEIGKVIALDWAHRAFGRVNGNNLLTAPPSAGTQLHTIGVAVAPKNVGKYRYWHPETTNNKSRHFPLGEGRVIRELFQAAGIAIDKWQGNEITTVYGNYLDEEYISIKLNGNGYSQRIALYRSKDFFIPGMDVAADSTLGILLRLRDHGCWFALNASSGVPLICNMQCKWDVAEADVRKWLCDKETKTPLACNLKPEMEFLWTDKLKASNQGSFHDEPVLRAGGLRDLVTLLKGRPDSALIDIVGEQPTSLFPRVSKWKDKEVWLCAETPKGSIPFSLGTSKTDLPRTLDPIHHISLASDEQLESLPDKGPKTKAAFTTTFPNWESSGSPANRMLELRRADRDTTSGAFAAFEIGLKDKENTPPMNSRLGALQIKPLDKWLYEEKGSKPSTLLLSLRPGQGAPHDRARIGAEFRWQLAIKAVEPVTVDIGRGDRDRDARPLLIAESTQTGVQEHPEGQPAFILNITESLQPGVTDWRLRATLRDNALDLNSASRIYTILSAEPFSLFRFSRERLEQAGGDDTNIVAEFDSDTRQWQFKRVNRYYRYVFPAQAVGESSDKPGRLELHDPKGETTEESIKPYPDNGTNDLQTYLVEWRLTPSTELWIRPSDLARSYFLPEWAAHDIFRQRNDFGLGAALAGMRGEFLYGLSVSVDPALESGPSKLARVAEVEALTGLLPREQVEEPRDKNEEQEMRVAVANRWLRLRRAMKRRHERLELWADRPDLPQRLAPAVFSDGVRFALRHTALHRTPVLPPDGYLVEEEPATKNGVRHHEQGLSGGALWPLESWNAFNRLLERSASSGGSIERIALGPTGGDADQKALFLNGIVTVVAETRGGYVQRQRIEILGRIGALWHRAKHVILYERTVNPSAQFAPVAGGDTRTRRPVIRKVREYIEIIQPRRNYPDFEAAPRMSGCLRAVQFNSNRIAVDSAWGRDIGDFGYEIPLWNRHAATIRPQVYALPDIAFLTAGDSDSDEISCTQECLDPDNLYFIADLSATDPDTDTDRWPSRIGLDTSDGLSAGDVLAVLNAHSDSGEQRRPSSARLLPGARRFTWRLAPGTGRTRINAGRGDKPLYAALDSITFMRAGGGGDEAKNQAQKDFLKVANNPVLQMPPWSAQLEPNPFAQLYNAFSELLNQTSPNKDKVLGALGQLTSAVDKKKSDIETGDFQKALKALVASGKSLDERLPAEPAPCDQLHSHVLNDLKRKRVLIEQNVRLAQRDISSFLSKFDWATDSDADNFKQQLQNQIKHEIDKRLTPLFDGAHTAIDKVNSQVAVARSIVLDAERDLESLLQRALRRLDGLASAYRDGKPWSPERLRQFDEKLAFEWNAIEGEVEAALEEARLRLASDISSSSRKLSDDVAETLAKVTRDKLRLTGHLPEAVDRARQYTASIRTPLVGLDEKLADLNKILEHIKTQLPDGNDKKFVEQMIKAVTNLKAQINNALSTVDGLKDLPSASIEKVFPQINEVFNAAKILASDSTKTITAINDLLKRLTNEVKNELAGQITPILDECKDQSTRAGNWLKSKLQSLGDVIDPSIDFAKQRLAELLLEVAKIKDGVFGKIDEWFTETNLVLDKARKFLQKDKITGFLWDSVFKPAWEAIIAGISDQSINEALKNGKDAQTKLIARLNSDLDHWIEQTLQAGGALDLLEKGPLDALTDACDLLSDTRSALLNGLKELAKPLWEEFEKLAQPFKDIETLINNSSWKEAIATAESLRKPLSTAVDAVANAGDNVRAFGQRLLEASSNLGKGGAEAVPGNLLRLYSAATQAPELAMLEVNCDRLRCAFDAAKDLIETTRASAYFQRLGDALKSIGLNLPFDGLTDQFRLDKEALKALDISRFFRGFGGINLRGLFNGTALPEDLNDAVHVNHDFDRKQLRAWVQIDIDVLVPGRRELFASGPFALNFLDTRLLGRLRFEAAADQSGVTESGRAEIVTSIEMVVSGQVLVTLEQVRISYTREHGLDFDFDPARIKLNEVFRFIQDTLATLFPEEVGGLAVVKENGIPVGIEHLFTLPPMSLSFGTSGVSNIQITNRFRLIAYPDFLIANRFNLSCAEQPFIFSFFVLGGTGYIQVDTEYRPVDGRLLVAVEAAAGASAALAFAFGPVRGAVYMTLSVAMTYRKLSNSPGALAVSLVLVVAGNVSLWNLVHIHLVLTLRMNYHGNGAVDGHGSLAVEVRVSRWFTLRYRTTVVYKLRDGRSTTTREESADAEPGEKLKGLQAKARELQEARG